MKSTGSERCPASGVWARPFSSGCSTRTGPGSSWGSRGRIPSGRRSSGTFVKEGRYLAAGKPEALVEVAFARQFGIRPGDSVSVAGRSFPVVGLVDASHAAKIAVANLYLPLPEAQAIAAASKPLQSVSPFAAGDVNLLFIKADQDKITDLASALKGLLGPKTTVATPDSFLKLLGSFFALSDKFTLIASLIAILIAVLIAFKTMAGNVAERVREIGVLKAVGWTRRNVTRQLLAESVVQCLIAGILGLAVAFRGRLRPRLHDGEHPHSLGDEPDAPFSSRRRRPGLQDPAASRPYPRVSGPFCRDALHRDRRPDRRPLGQSYF